MTDITFILNLDADKSRNEQHTLIIAADKLEVRVIMQDSRPQEYILDDYEMPANCDTPNAIYVKINGKFYSLAEIGTVAAVEWNKIYDDAAQDGKDEAQYEEDVRREYYESR